MALKQTTTTDLTIEDDKRTFSLMDGGRDKVVFLLKKISIAKFLDKELMDCLHVHLVNARICSYNGSNHDLKLDRFGTQLISEDNTITGSNWDDFYLGVFKSLLEDVFYQPIINDLQHKHSCMIKESDKKLFHLVKILQFLGVLGSNAEMRKPKKDITLYMYDLVDHDDIHSLLDSATIAHDHERQPVYNIGEMKQTNITLDHSQVIGDNSGSAAQRNEDVSKRASSEINFFRKIKEENPILFWIAVGGFTISILTFVAYITVDLKLF